MSFPSTDAPRNQECRYRWESLGAAARDTCCVEINQAGRYDKQMIHWNLCAKVERAEMHLKNLQAEWNKYRADAFLIQSKDDLHAAERIWYIAHTYPIPLEMSLITGDAVHCLRCCLDHVIYHLVKVCTAGQGPFKQLYFPTGEDPADFAGRLQAASEYKPKGGVVVQRIRPDAIKAIQAFEPFAGGSGALLRHVHQLDIIDKHHLLLTVASSNPTHSMPPTVIERYKHGFGIKDEYTPAQEALIFQTESLARFPLKAGDELARVSIADANENMTFTFALAFGEPKAVAGKPIIQTLYQASLLIRDMIRKFDGLGLFA